MEWLRDGGNFASPEDKLEAVKQAVDYLKYIKPSSFTPEAVNYLKSLNLEILTIGQTSLAELLDRGVVGVENAIKNSKFILNERFPVTQVAFNPDPCEFVLKDSARVTYGDKINMVLEMDQNMQREFGSDDIYVGLGQAVQYAEISMQMYRDYCLRLFDSSYGYPTCTITSTPIRTPGLGSELMSLMVGRLRKQDPLMIGYFGHGKHARNIPLMPLYFPKGNFAKGF